MLTVAPAPPAPTIENASSVNPVAPVVKVRATLLPPPLLTVLSVSGAAVVARMGVPGKASGDEVSPSTVGVKMTPANAGAEYAAAKTAAPARVKNFRIRDPPSLRA